MKAKGNNMTGQPVCVELLRVSTPKQVELGGLDSQHTDCVSIAKQHNVTLHPEQIRLPGVSGKNVRLTPEIQRLEVLLRSGQFTGVVMVEDTRLMRPDQPEDYALLQVFKDTGARIYTRTVVHDLSTPEGQMMAQILFAIGARERHIIRARTYGKREKLRARGLCASGAGTLPYGVTRVRFNDGEAERWAYAWDESKIGKVRRLFDLFVSGVTSFRELERLTGLEYSQVRHILKSTAYTGVRTYDQRIDPSRDVLDDLGRLRYQTKVKRAEDEIERVPMIGADGKPLLPAVPLDLFAQAQSILSLKSEMLWRRNNTNPEPFGFRGFVKCARCGARLICAQQHASRGGQVRDYYTCKRTRWPLSGADGIKHQCATPLIKREVLDPALEVVVKSKLADPEFLYAVMLSQRAALERDDSKLNIERTRKELDGLEAERARLNTLYIKGRLSDLEYDSEAAALDQSVAAARHHLNQLTPSVPSISPKDLVRVIAPFERWDFLSANERRALLAAVCPLFEVLAWNNGKRGRGAKLFVEVTGFWLRLSADNAAPGVQVITRGRLAHMPQTRINTHPHQLVSDLCHTSTASITNNLVFIPLAA